MEGLGGIQDIRQRGRESLVGWLTEVLFRLPMELCNFSWPSKICMVVWPSWNPVSGKGDIGSGSLGVE